MKKKIWEAENFFYLNSDISRLNKIITHYEIFKLTEKIPGKILEFGIFKGNSLIRFLSFRNLLNLSRKKVIGFDAFGDFPKQKINEDNKFAKNHDKYFGKGHSVTNIIKSLEKKKIDNFKLIKGNIMKTLPIFLKKQKNLKISFLHLDLDVYEPTKFVLNTLFKKISKNGLVLIDDYGKIKGATNATDEFLKKNRKLRLQTLEFNKTLKFFIKR